MLFTTTDSFLRKYAPDMTAEQRAEFGEEFKQREIAAVKAHGRLFDGAYELLESLAGDGIEMAICGMGSREYIHTVLDHCGIAHFFKAVYFRVDGLTKGQVMTKLLSDFGVAANECLMVGDSITDITAARENGVPFIGVAYGYGAKDIADAEVLAYDMAQLRTAIYQLRQPQ